MENRVKLSRILIFFLFLIFLFWSLLQFIIPMMLPGDSVQDLTGLTGVSDNEDIISNMDFPSSFIYSVGDRMCHQKADRSFFINGNQMPFCSRCTAIWLGLAIGLGLMFFLKLKIDEKFVYIIIIGILPIGIDGLGQLFGLWESTNLIRVITGLLIGVVCGISIGLIIDEIRDIKSKKV